VGSRAGLDAVAKRTILSPYRESNPSCDLLKIMYFLFDRLLSADLTMLVDVENRISIVALSGCKVTRILSISLVQSV